MIPLVKNGRVIDPAQKLDDKLDIAISKGKIVKVAKGIPSRESKQVIDAGGKIVTPGLIDVHCHVYDILKKVPHRAGRHRRKARSNYRCRWGKRG